jgi:hypothetical protein
MYTKTFCLSRNTPSISHWKLAEHPKSPIVEVIQWNCSFPRIVNAIRCWVSSASFIWQKPEVRSSVEKMLEFAQPMSLMHLVVFVDM